MNEKPFLLIGSNIRFLAQNAVRHGHNIFTVDYYGDLDTKRLSPNRSILREGSGEFSLSGLVTLADGIENAGIIYGPGFENEPDTLALLGEVGALMGTSRAVIGNVRDPERLARSACAHRFSYPDTRMNGKDIPEHGRWLVKPLRSLGGAGVHFADSTERSLGNGDGTCFQEFVEGSSSSALLCSGDYATTLIGVTGQIIGEAEFGASEFRYVGNVYPHPLSGVMAPSVASLGRILADEFGLRGLWGFDFVYNGQVTLIEVNPRPTAGMGPMGMATGYDLVGAHVGAITGAAITGGATTGSAPVPANLFTAWGRVYAVRDTWFHDPEKWMDMGAMDIPFDGGSIPAGAPILTLSATDTSYRGVMEKLKSYCLSVKSM